MKRFDLKNQIVYEGDFRISWDVHYTSKKYFENSDGTREGTYMEPKRSQVGFKHRSFTVELVDMPT